MFPKIAAANGLIQFVSEEVILEWLSIVLKVRFDFQKWISSVLLQDI